MEEPYISTSKRTDDLVEKFLNLPDKILLDNFNKISPEHRKQIRDDYINMCMNRKDSYRLLFPVDKIFKNFTDDRFDYGEDLYTVKKVHNINYLKSLLDALDFFRTDGVDFTLEGDINIFAYYRENNEDDLLLISVFELFLPGRHHHPKKRVELDKNGKGIKILKFETADEFALYCTKQGGVYSARDRDCISIEELRGRQAIVILKDEEDGKNDNRNYLMSFDYIDDEISNIAEPYAISYKFIKKIDLDKKTVKKTQPVLKRVMRF